MPCESTVKKVSIEWSCHRISSTDSILRKKVYRVSAHVSSGGLSNDEGDVNKNGKKAIGLDWQNNNFARASLFFVHFFAVVARLRRESAFFHVLSRMAEHKTTTFFFFS